MFDELSTAGAEYEAPRQPAFQPEAQPQSQIEAAVSEVLAIESMETGTTQRMPARVLGHFSGQLRLDADTAFDTLDAALADLNAHAYMTTDQQSDKHQVVVLEGRYAPPERPWYLNAVLLVLTVFSTMFVGATMSGSFAGLGDIFTGLPYAISIMLILGAHELGHYFAARHHNVAVTLPYFIPMPFLFFGTLGAFIQLREPMRNRKQLFDVGVAGPLAGLIFAIPILFLGIYTSEIEPLPTEEDCAEDESQCGYILEGNSIFYGAAKYVVHGEWLPSDSRDMFLNQFAFAGWTGLFVTGLNLLPVGQLDGGHVLYTLLGPRARRLYWPALIFMIVLAFNNPGWILWVFLLLFFGRAYAVPMNDITPLDPRRRILGIIALLIFVLVFVPSPVSFVNLAT
ncbi:MAG: site-2 protease family protein [Anaerolineales bacterium]